MTHPIRLLVCGSRHWTDREAIRAELVRQALPPGSVVIHGAARGADTLAGEVAREMGLAVEEYPADWSQGKKAGPLRNERMVRECRPDRAVGFTTDLQASVGTRDCLRRAYQAGVPVRVVGQVGGVVEWVKGPDGKPVKP